MEERIRRYEEGTKKLIMEIEAALKKLANRWGPLLIIPVALNLQLESLESLSEGLRKAIEAAVFAWIRTGEDKKMGLIISRFEKDVKKVLMQVEDLKMRLNILGALKKRLDKPNINNRGH